MSEINLVSTQEQQPRPFLVRPVRCQVKLPLQVTHHVFVGTRVTEGVCTDLHEYGMGADIPQPLSVGEIVQFALELPAGRLEAFARVIYRARFHYGFYFVDLEPERREQLSDALETLKRWPKTTVQ